MPLLPICATHTPQERKETLPHRTAEATAHLRMQGFSRETRIQLASEFGEKTVLLTFGDGEGC
jgi:hypothetical protein